MKYVYVLVSNESDLYLEQLYVSLVSFRKVMPLVDDVYVLVDQDTNETLVNYRAQIKNLAHIVVINLPHSLSNKERSRYLKTTIHKYIEGDFLFIDCDTVICENLSSIENYRTNIYAVLDTHQNKDSFDIKDHNCKMNKKVGFSNPYNYNFFFNSGVYLFNDSKENRDFMDKWHELLKQSISNGVCFDQPALNEANYLFGDKIKELPGIWNCQVYSNALPYIGEAKIIHYFSTSLATVRKLPYKFTDSQIYIDLKQTGKLSDDVIKMLESPKSAFVENTLLVAEPADIKAYYNKITRLIHHFYRLRFYRKW